MKSKGMLGCIAVTVGFAFAAPAMAACEVTQALCGFIPPGAERALCEANAAYVDPKLDNACDTALNLADPYAAIGGGAKTGGSPPYQIAVTISSVYSAAAGTAVNVCTAQAPGASGITIECGSTTLPGVGGTAVAAGLSSGLGSVCALAVWFTSGVQAVDAPLAGVAGTANACANATITANNRFLLDTVAGP